MTVVEIDELDDPENPPAESMVMCERPTCKAIGEVKYANPGDHFCQWYPT
jgi:hypothetical protein